MKNSNLYINHQNKHKPNFEPLIDFLLMLGIGIGIITIILCL